MKSLLQEAVKVSGTVKQRVLRETSELEKCEVVLEKYGYKVKSGTPEAKKFMNKAGWWETVRDDTGSDAA
jgi:hypothetical protein